MNQILHIFKKDIRHHWPEILISVALLAVYFNQACRIWSDDPRFFRASTFFLLSLSQEYAAPALIISWIFLIIRIVQGESLVGDRQWWVTKPYVWWQLLLAKLLFLFVFIIVPLFHVQLFLLHHFRFPVFSNLVALARFQFSLFVLFVCFDFLLASLTKNLGQLLIVLGVAALVTISVAAWMSQDSSSSAMVYTAPLANYLSDFLIWGALVAAVVWQFARRRRWMAIAGIAAFVVVSIGVSAPFTSTNANDRLYPLVDSASAPVRVVPKPIEPSNDWKDFTHDSSKVISLSIPVTISGVSSGTLLQLRGVRVYADSPEPSPWSRDWIYEHALFWPEDQEHSISYEVNRKKFETVRTQPLHLRIELALSEYRFANSRPLLITSNNFTDDTLGTCRILSFDTTPVRCFTPIRTPAYILRFDPAKSGCTGGGASNSTQQNRVSYAWNTHDEPGFPDPELSPISINEVYFQTVSLSSDTQKESKTPRVPPLCRGTELTLSQPIHKRDLRIQIDLPNVRLEDLAVGYGRWR